MTLEEKQELIKSATTEEELQERMKQIEDDKEEVKEEVLSIVKFEKVYLQKASPAISINCGPGTFGLLYSRK